MKNCTTIAQLPLTEGVRVAASNSDGLVALDKPEGVRSHPNSEADSKPSILAADYDYQQEQFTWRDRNGVECRAWLINRLDSPTSGILLLGLNPEITAVIKQQFLVHKVEKVYFAVVRHAVKSKSGVWRDRLRKPAQSGSGGAKRSQQEVPAVARYLSMTTPRLDTSLSLLRLSPSTGRTHQLRIQCQQHGHPILGDQTYGDFAFNRAIQKSSGLKRMFLHSGQTSVRYAFEGKLCNFEASSPLPDAFQTVLQSRVKAASNSSSSSKSNSTSRKGPQSKLSSRLAQRRFRR